MSNPCESDTNVTNLKLEGSFLNFYNNSTPNPSCMKIQLAVNQGIYVMSKDKYDSILSGSDCPPCPPTRPPSSCTPCPSTRPPNSRECYTTSCSNWTSYAIIFLVLSIVLAIVCVILGIILLRKK
jgi:hypothetical protein